MEKISAIADIREIPGDDIPADSWDWLLRAAILFGLAVIAYASLCGGIFSPVFNKVSASRLAKILLRPSLMWGAMGVVFLFFRTFLWFRYRPIPAATFGKAPFLTVIIPAFNEGPMVEKTIDSVAAAVYPRDRLEIFVVDDGSKDDTWMHIQHAAMRHPGLVTTVRFRKNRGKRSALEEGFRKAKGEIAVTIDSDSVITPCTLLAMAGPFRDDRVGAVAGKVAVYNREQGVIPKMLHVKYMLSFDFLRAVQSTYSTVYCCPGALAAYRMAAVRDVLGEWIEQSFLGVRCTYGEDRSLTNYILSRGYDTVYQRSAVVYTIVPRTYSKLTKMFLRWDRSYVREELRLARIAWRRKPGARLITLWDLAIKNMRYPIGYATLALLVMLSVSDPTTILRLLFAIGLMALFNMFYYLRSERSWDFLYGMLYAYFSFFALFWVFPWAVLTVRSRSWMTR
ncbi:MAG: glycosyltransferase [Candidatus Sulfobium sp.]